MLQHASAHTGSRMLIVCYIHWSEKILCSMLRFVVYSIYRHPRNYNQATQKPNTHSDPLFVSCQIEWVKDVLSPVFVLSHKTNYTHMYEFLWSTAAISASDKTEPKSGNHQMPPTLPLYHIKRQCTQAHTHSHTQTCTRKQVQQCYTQKAHMLTRKTALCSLYLPTDADDRAADECRLTRDERVHVAS